LLADINSEQIIDITPDDNSISLEVLFPQKYELAAPYPNPFNSAVVLPFRLSRDSRVELAIYNALGQREALLLQGRLGAGEHRVRWEGASAASGNYLAVLNVDGKMRMRQLALIK